MAPEQALGKSAIRPVTPAVDVHALGVILYEMLTGRLPFRGETVLETLEQVCSQEPVPPSQLRPRLPPDLETVCLKCLEKEPQRRYASAADLADDLRAFQERRPIKARPVGRLGRAWRWCRRNPVVAGLLTALFLVLAVGLAGVSWKWREAEDEKEQKEYQRQQAEAARQAEQREKQRAQKAETVAKNRAAAEKRAREQAQTDRDKARRAQRRAEEAAYLRAIALADREFFANHVSRSIRLLEECPRPLRRWEWYYLRRRPHLDLYTLSGHAKGVNAVAFSPKGEWLASASVDATVKVWRARDGRPVVSFGRHRAGVTCVAFHPKKGDLVFSGGRDGTVRVWSGRTGKEVRPALRPGGFILALALSPDGGTLVTGGSQGEPDTSRVPLIVWDARTGRVLRSLPGHSRPVSAVAFSPDGKWLASAGMDNTVRLWDTAAWKQTQTFRGEVPQVYDRCVAFSPDSQWLAWGGPEGAVKIWKLGTAAKEVLVLGTHADCVNGLAFSPDGRHLASASLDQTLKIWNWPFIVKKVRALQHLDNLAQTKAVVTLRGHTHFVAAVAYSPDGKVLASGSDDTTVKVWDAVNGWESSVLTRQASAVTDLTVSADGRFLAYPNTDQGKDGKQTHWATVWDVRSNTPYRTVEGIPTFANSVALRPDGKVLAIGKNDQTVSVWDLATGAQTVLRGHSRPVRWVRFSGDGKRLASASGGGGMFFGPVGRDRPGEVLVWDATDWSRKPLALRGHTQGITCLAFHPDGKRLASGSWDGTVRVWDRGTGRSLATLTGHTDGVAALAFSADGKQLGTSSFQPACFLWDVGPARAAPKKRLTLKQNAVPVGLAFTPDGERLVTTYTGLFTAQIKVWDTDTGKQLLTLPGHSASVTCALFSPDGQKLFTGGLDDTVRVWDGTPLKGPRGEKALGSGRKAGR
jgi:WD40 repeat protein